MKFFENADDRPHFPGDHYVTKLLTRTGRFIDKFWFIYFRDTGRIQVCVDLNFTLAAGLQSQIENVVKTLQAE